MSTVYTKFYQRKDFILLKNQDKFKIIMYLQVI